MEFTLFFYIKEQERRQLFIKLCNFVPVKPERTTTMSIHFTTGFNTINEFALQIKRTMRNFPLSQEDCIQIFGMQYRDQLLHTPLKLSGKTHFSIDNFGDFIY